MNAGFILLYRQITEWEWYQNPNTFRVFLHCLLMANFTDGRFEGKEIKRGQFVTSLPSLSDQTSLSIRQVRVALDHLIMTGELTSKSYSKFRVITVVNYDKYQNNDRQNDSQMTDKRQADDRQVTGKRQQYNNNKKETREQGNNHLHQEPPQESFLPDDEAAQIQNDHNAVLDAAQNAGFKSTPAERAGLLNLYAAHGLEKMIAGIGECVTHSAPNLAYLTAVLKGTPKADKTYNRDYSKDQDAAFDRLVKMGRKTDARDVHGYEQRDYSGEQAQALKRMMESDW